jgi:hypothetical protein
LASLSYNAPGSVQQVFAFVKQQLVDQQWKELPNAYVSDQAASGTFARGGFTVSASVFPAGNAGAVSVNIINHGNVDLGKLPAPQDVKPFYGGPVNTAYITETPVKETADTCRKLLLEHGWQPYGTAGESMFFKQNAVRLAARVAAAPAQGGKTVIDYSASLMSVDLPAPAETEQLQYADVTSQLLFDTKATPSDIASFYRDTLAKAGWTATTEKPFKSGFKDTLIFRNPQKDMLTLEMHEVEGKNRVVLKHQAAAEIASIEQRIREEAERKKAAKPASLPKLTLALPAEAKGILQTKNRLEFKLAAGKAKATVELWRTQLTKDGWKEEVAALDAMAGSISFRKGDQSVSVMYADTGFLPAEVTLQTSGVELDRAAGNP